jgi:hypothetical protein
MWIEPGVAVDLELLWNLDSAVLTRCRVFGGENYSRSLRSRFHWQGRARSRRVRLRHAACGSTLVVLQAVSAFLCADARVEWQVMVVADGPAGQRSVLRLYCVEGFEVRPLR